MANPKLLATNLDNWTLTSTVAANPSYPLSNLLSYYPDQKWVGSSLADSTHIWIDTGVSQTMDAFVLENYGCDSDIGLYVQVSPNNSTWTNVSTPLSENSEAEWHSFSSSTYRYVRLLWDTSGGYYDYPYLGNFYIGQALEFSTPYDWGYKKDNAQYETSEYVAIDGRIRTSQAYSGRYLWEIKFSAQSDTVKSNFQTFLSTIKGKLRPFYLLDTDGVTVRYFHLDSDYSPVTVRRYGINDIETLKLKEQIATR